MNDTTTPEQGKVLLREVLSSWERHTRILTNLANKIGKDEMNLKASEDGLPIYEIFCHIHAVRYGWLSRVSEKHSEVLGDVHVEVGDDYIAITDLDEIRKQLGISGRAVAEATEELILSGVTKGNNYDHPIQFLQHMLWHEAGHYSIINLALRLGGKELSEDWEEKNVWGVWRFE